MTWDEAHDVKIRIKEIVSVLGLEHVDVDRVFCYRTEGSKARAYARCWGFPRIFQRALGVEPAYVIEVLSKHFDKKSQDDQDYILIHELLHIPKNFSGALLPHHTRARNLHKTALALHREYKKRSGR